MPTAFDTEVPDLLAHVPVDMFYIVYGPSSKQCSKAFKQLYVHVDSYVELEFTLKTDASESTFKRKLKIAVTYGESEGTFAFGAVFSGRVISGVYDTIQRTGWFKLD